MGKQQPDFGKRKPLVWYDFKAGLINLTSTINILSFQLLVDGIVYPQVYVTPPVSFFLKQKHATVLDGR